MTLPARSIDRGIPMLAVNAAVVVGVAAAQEFAGPSQEDAQPVLRYLVQVPSGALTTLTFQLQVSPDQGATWINRGAAIDGVANPSGDLPAVYEGVICRLNVLTLALNTAPSVSIKLTT